MATRKRKAKAPSKTRSGPYVPNSQRHTVAVTLRLPPDVAAELKARATREGVTIAGLVGAMLAR